ncbi:MAG: SUF system NifU family Fe-S cluster assembly protein [Erysipelotrichaceae bacterium]|nr:SUF system NifU family Fe-S cluster assembly protein [Erysipelotrichaceae bacterium]MDY6034081.1 SUF system NifU family Fe-S cluster assembly protein [Bulleidia sp.]
MSEVENLMNDPQVLRELIMDHYQYPHNHKLIKDNGYMSVHMASDSCIDDITVQSDIKDGIIQDIRFDGIACTISTASTSMMTDLLKGKSIAEAREIIKNYFDMIEEKDYDPELLQEAVALKNVYKQANRIKCATIGWKAIEEMIDESEAKK